MSSQWTRRKFLKNSSLGILGVGTAQILGACSNLAKIIDGDLFDQTKSVVILGGGLAGLVAARELKKSGIRFRIYEGSHRVGGRILTVDHFNSALHTAEMGGEWISRDHDAILQLCKELKISTYQTRDAQEGFVFHPYNKKNNTRLFSQVHVSLTHLREQKTAEQWDQASVQDLIDYLNAKKDSAGALWVRRITQYFWGCDPSELSALSYFEKFTFNPAGEKQLYNQRVRVAGGMGHLIDVLFERTTGVIPGQFYQLNHKLVEVEDKGEEVLLSFETPLGKTQVLAKYVICTIPFSVLRTIRGIDSLQLSPMKLQAIQELGYGSHGKMSFSMPQRFWLKKGWIFSGDIDSQWIWESSIRNSVSQLGMKGVLTAQVAGHAGKELGLHSREEFFNDLIKLGFPVDRQSENEQLMNWTLSPWSRGSRSYLKPHQANSFPKAIATAERNNTLFFAGEHCSATSMGTMNGACESAQRVVKEIIRLRTL